MKDGDSDDEIAELRIQALLTKKENEAEVAPTFEGTHRPPPTSALNQPLSNYLPKSNPYGHPRPVQKSSYYNRPNYNYNNREIRGKAINSSNIVVLTSSEPNQHWNGPPKHNQGSNWAGRIVPDRNPSIQKMQTPPLVLPQDANSNKEPPPTQDSSKAKLSARMQRLQGSDSEDSESDSSDDSSSDSSSSGSSSDSSSSDSDSDSDSSADATKAEKQRNPKETKTSDEKTTPISQAQIAKPNKINNNAKPPIDAQPLDKRSIGTPNLNKLPPSPDISSKIKHLPPEKPQFTSTENFNQSQKSKSSDSPPKMSYSSGYKPNLTSPRRGQTFRSRSRSPGRLKSPLDSPYQFSRRFSKSPPPRRYISKSPERPSKYSRFRSTSRSRSRSPFLPRRPYRPRSSASRDRSYSPPPRRYLSKSPLRKRSPLPPRKFGSKSPPPRKLSPLKRLGSRSPYRRYSSRTPPPRRYSSRSPPPRRYISRSPTSRRLSRSPLLRRISRSPLRKFSPNRRLSRTPPPKRFDARLFSKSPPMRGRNLDETRRSKSPLTLSRSPKRHNSQSPKRRIFIRSPFGSPNRVDSYSPLKKYGASHPPLLKRSLSPLSSQRRGPRDPFSPEAARKGAPKAYNDRFRSRSPYSRGGPPRRSLSPIKRKFDRSLSPPFNKSGNSYPFEKDSKENYPLPYQRNLSPNRNLYSPEKMRGPRHWSPKRGHPVPFPGDELEHVAKYPQNDSYLPPHQNIHIIRPAFLSRPPPPIRHPPPFRGNPPSLLHPPYAENRCAPNDRGWPPGPPPREFPDVRFPSNNRGRGFGRSDRVGHQLHANPPLIRGRGSGRGISGRGMHTRLGRHSPWHEDQSHREMDLDYHEGAPPKHDLHASNEFDQERRYDEFDDFPRQRSISPPHRHIPRGPRTPPYSPPQREPSPIEWQKQRKTAKQRTPTLSPSPGHNLKLPLRKRSKSPRHHNTELRMMKEPQEDYSLSRDSKHKSRRREPSFDEISRHFESRGDSPPAPKSRGDSPHSKSRGDSPHYKSHGDSPHSKSRGDLSHSKSHASRHSRSREKPQVSNHKGHKKDSVNLSKSRLSSSERSRNFEKKQIVQDNSKSHIEKSSKHDTRHKIAKPVTQSPNKPKEEINRKRDRSPKEERQGLKVSKLKRDDTSLKEAKSPTKVRDKPHKSIEEGAKHARKSRSPKPDESKGETKKATKESTKVVERVKDDLDKGSGKLKRSGEIDKKKSEETLMMHGSEKEDKKAATSTSPLKDKKHKIRKIKEEEDKKKKKKKKDVEKSKSGKKKKKEKEKEEKKKKRKEKEPKKKKKHKAHSKHPLEDDHDEHEEEVHISEQHKAMLMLDEPLMRSASRGYSARSHNDRNMLRENHRWERESPHHEQPQLQMENHERKEWHNHRQERPRPRYEERERNPRREERILHDERGGERGNRRPQRRGYNDEYPRDHNNFVVTVGSGVSRHVMHNNPQNVSKGKDRSSDSSSSRVPVHLRLGARETNDPKRGYSEDKRRGVGGGKSNHHHHVHSNKGGNDRREMSSDHRSRKVK